MDLDKFKRIIKESIEEAYEDDEASLFAEGLILKLKEEGLLEVHK